MRPSKEKSFKVHIKKTTTLLNTYYFTIIFQGVSLGLKPFDVAVYKDRRVAEAAIRECSSEKVFLKISQRKIAVLEAGTDTQLYLTELFWRLLLLFSGICSLNSF